MSVVSLVPPQVGRVAVSASQSSAVTQSGPSGGSVSGESIVAGRVTLTAPQVGATELTSLQIDGVEVLAVGPQGSSGGAQASAVAAIAIAAGFVITPQADGTVIYHDASIAAFIARPAWYATQSANVGGTLLVQFIGEVTDASWTWTQDAPVFLGAQGRLTQTPPSAPGSAFMLALGYATSPTSLYFSPLPPIALAP